VGKSLGKLLLGISRRRWEDNIKIDLRERSVRNRLENCFLEYREGDGRITLRSILGKDL
jgi:hypothetical protein